MCFLQNAFLAKLRNSAVGMRAFPHDIQRKIFVENWRAMRVANQRSVIQLRRCRLQGDAMGTANLTTIKDRIAELVPEPRHKTAAARSRQHRQRRKQTKNVVTTTVVTAPADPRRRPAAATASLAG